MPSIISGNWVSIFLPLTLFLIGEGLRVRKEGWSAIRWDKVRRDFLLTFAAYCFLFVWAIVHTTYKDHKDLAHTISELRDKQISQTPELRLDLEHGITLIATESKTDTALFVASGAVINRRGPETATTNWQMWIDHLPNGEILHGRMIPNLPRDTDLRITNPSFNGVFVAEPSEFWPELTSQPMKSGSVSMGWIWCEFPITLSDLDKEEKTSVLHVQFVDVLSGSIHEATVPLNTASRFTNPPWFSKVPKVH